LYSKVLKHFNGDLKDKTIGLWGLSFKPLTDDMREAPSLALIKRFLESGAKVRAYDPVAMDESRRILGGHIEYAKDQYDALNNADCLVLATEWPEFKFPDFTMIRKLLRNPVVFDGRNIYDPTEMRKKDFIYYCIGIDTLK